MLWIKYSSSYIFKQINYVRNMRIVEKFVSLWLAILFRALKYAIEIRDISDVS